MPLPVRRRALPVLAAGALLATLSGCSIAVGTPGASGSGPAPSSTAQPSASAPASDPVPSISVPTPSVPPVSVPPSDGGPGIARGGGGTLAPGFPVPAGSRVTVAHDDSTGETAGGIRVPGSAAAAFAFFRAQLPEHGYTVSSAEGSGGIGEIRFSGHGCGGDSQLAFTGGSTVQYQCDAD